MSDKKRSVIFKIGRNADTGKFETVKKAQQHHTKAVVETIKRPR